MTIQQSFFQKLSDICADIAQVCLASLVIPFIIGKLDWLLAVPGLIITIFFWAISLLLTKELQ